MSGSPAAEALPPIVLVHGCGGSLEATFQETGWMDALRRAGRLPIGLHLPGHGIIPAPRDPAHYADLAALLAEKLPLGVLDAVGFSLGSKLLLEARGAFAGPYQAPGVGRSRR